MIEGSWQLAKKNMVGKDVREKEMSVSWIFGKLNPGEFFYEVFCQVQKSQLNTTNLFLLKKK